MRMILFSSRQYDSETFKEANSAYRYDLHFQESHLDFETAVLAEGFEVVCPFVNCGSRAAARGRHAPDRAAFGRLQSRRSGGGAAAGSAGGARAGVFAARGG
jgi:D-lactate dehydrogenase